MGTETSLMVPKNPYGRGSQCTAKSKQSQQRCKRAASPPFDKCAMHGGKSLVGPALPQYKHGRYSKYLPKGLVDKYNNAVSDTELVTLRHEIALVDAKLLETLETAQKGELSFEKIQPMIEQRRRLVDSESKRLREMENNLTITQAMQIIHLLTDIVKRHVTDPKQLKAIATELAEAAYQ